MRDTNLNPGYTIRDSITDSSGNLWQIVDERGTVSEMEFDSRGHAIAQTASVGTAVQTRTETGYDAAGNMAEIRSPRYFDAADLNGYQKCRTEMTYDGANRLLSRTVSLGASKPATCGRFKTSRGVNVQ